MQQVQTVRKPYPRDRKSRPSVLARRGHPDVHPAGHYIAREIRARGLTPRVLADAMRYPLDVVLQILGGSLLTSKDVTALAGALRTSAEVLRDLDMEWREHLASKRR